MSGVPDSTSPERRNLERRRFARGGRRTDDPAGYFPLVFIVDSNSERLDELQSHLLALRFAVAPFTSADGASAALVGLRPDAIVAADDQLPLLAGSLPKGRGDDPVPLIPIAPAIDVTLSTLRQVFRDAFASKTPEMDH